MSLARAPRCFSSISVRLCVANPRVKSFTLPLPSVFPRIATIPSGSNSAIGDRALDAAGVVRRGCGDAMDVGAHVSSRAFRNDRAPRVRDAAAPRRARRSARCRSGSARADPRSSRADRCRSTSPSRVTVLPPTISSLMWRMVERANRRSSGSRSGRSRSASSLSQSMTSRSAGAPGARTPPFSLLVTERRPLTRTAFRMRLSIDIDTKSGSGVQQVGEAHFAQRVVVLIERRAVEAERDTAAALHHLGKRRDAGAQMQVGGGVDRNRDAGARPEAQARPAAPRCNAPASARSLRKPIESRYSTMPSGKFRSAHSR